MLIVIRGNPLVVSPHIMGIIGNNNNNNIDSFDDKMIL
nr:MAG TPA: hypothetical protein [Bacteriophage sp.]